MNTSLSDPALWHRIQFAFTITYHYLFPQLTMGLAWFLVYWKWHALRTGDEQYNLAARFWAKIFGLNFAVGVVTGIPMEFQFGTNWAGFTQILRRRHRPDAGHGRHVRLLSGERFHRRVDLGRKAARAEDAFSRRGRRGDLEVGSPAYFIIVTNAFMQHPRRLRHRGGRHPRAQRCVSAYLFNPWAFVQMCAQPVAALWSPARSWSPRSARSTRCAECILNQARLYLNAGTLVGLIASVLVAFPDRATQQAKMVGRHQPVTLAAMEGRFQGGRLAERHDHRPAERRGAAPGQSRSRCPVRLSFLAYGTFRSYVHGLNEFPREPWPDNIELLYYAFHLMVTLGTMFIAIMAWATWQRWRGQLDTRLRWLLWVLMLAFPFPYIANTLGWMTAELGRQPWLIYGLFRTHDGYSKAVSTGDTVFTLIGFVGLYFVLGVLFFYLVGREIYHGPDATAAAGK